MTLATRSVAEGFRNCLAVGRGPTRRNGKVLARPQSDSVVNLGLAQKGMNIATAQWVHLSQREGVIVGGGLPELSQRLEVVRLVDWNIGPFDAFGNPGPQGA